VGVLGCPAFPVSRKVKHRYNADLYHGANLDDRVIHDMFQDKFVLLADAVFEYVLSPRNLNASCKALSEIAVLRTSVTFPDSKSEAYAMFLDADNIFWPVGTPNVPGDYLSLFVEATGAVASRKKKRGRSQFEGGDVDGIAAMLRAR
jgi:hypothetical protein